MVIGSNKTTPKLIAFEKTTPMILNHHDGILFHCNQRFPAVNLFKKCSSLLYADQLQFMVAITHLNLFPPLTEWEIPTNLMKV